MRRKTWWSAGAGVLLVVLIAGAAGGARTPNAVISSVVGSAGAPATGSGVAANGTATQPTPIGTAAGGGIVLHAGFWGQRWVTVTGVESPDLAKLPTALRGNYPNPFNPQTRIEFTVADPCRVRLEIFDPKGRLVRTLLDETRPAGIHHAIWDGTDPGGRHVASGVYFFRLHAGDYESSMKMTMVK